MPSPRARPTDTRSGSTAAAALSAIPFMVSKMPFDWQKDLALLTLVVRVREVLVVHPSVRREHVAGAGRLCARQSAQDQLRLGRHRHHHASGGRAAQDRSQDRSRARSLSRRGAGGERPARRPHPDDRARHSGAAAAHPRRRGQAAGGDVGDAQRRACPTCRPPARPVSRPCCPTTGTASRRRPACRPTFSTSCTRRRSARCSRPS